MFIWCTALPIQSGRVDLEIGGKLRVRRRREYTGEVCGTGDNYDD
jgi:hypothetical protein